MGVWIFSIYLLVQGITLVPFVDCMMEYHYISLSKTWSDARQYCRAHYRDLATVENADDLYRIKIPSGTAWIGLFDDPASWKGVFGNIDVNSWKWSATGTTIPGGFQYWNYNEPNKYLGLEACVMVQHNVWKDCYCESNIFSVCYTAQSGLKQYFFVNTSLSWPEAVDYCRQNYLDLAMIESSAENQAVLQVIQSQTVWIGLYRTPWRWSDLNPSPYRNWEKGQLDNLDWAGEGENCIAQDSLQGWYDLPCSSVTPFVCEQVVNSSSRLQIKLQTDVDLTDAAVQNLLLKLLEESLEKKTPRTDFRLKWNKAPTKKKDKD